MRAQRPKFVSLLSRYWDLFLSTWNVLLHGNPACNIYGGIKIAASGELGVGVGEEDRGSGEREVLEGMVDRVEGLVDLVVGKYGEPGEEGKEPTEWLGTGAEPGADDGAIFLGTGALSRQSLRSVAWWMEDMYTWGENAYGVIESPTATRVAPRRRHRKEESKAKIANIGEVMSPGLKVSDLRLPPLKPKPTQTSTPQSEVEQSNKTTSDSDGRPAGPPRPVTSLHPPAKGKGPASPTGTGTGTPASPTTTDDQGGVGHLFSYLKMGYGTHWSLGMGGSSQPAEKQKEKVEDQQKPKKPPKDSQFLIGLMGDLEGTPATSPDGEPIDPFGTEDSNSRLLLRTLTVEVEGEDRRASQFEQDFGSHDTELAESKPQGTSTATVTVTDDDGHRRVTTVTTANSPASTLRKNPVASRSINLPGSGHGSSLGSKGSAGTTGITSAATSFDSQDRNKTKKLRVIVYVMRPFIFVFLFQLRTDSLAWEGFYRNLHQQMAPLRKSLLRATAYRPERPFDTVAGGSGQIYDLVWDPKELTVHSTIPNIPEPPIPVAAGVVGGSETAPAKAAKAHWSRVEALNTHNQILNMFVNTRDDNLTGYERTCKTSRGWWVVWNRILERTAAAAESQGHEQRHILSVSSSGQGSTRTASPVAGAGSHTVTNQDTDERFFSNVNKPRRERRASDQTLRRRRTSVSSSAEPSPGIAPSGFSDPTGTAAAPGAPATTNVSTTSPGATSNLSSNPSIPTDQQLPEPGHEADTEHSSDNNSDNSDNSDTEDASNEHEHVLDERDFEDEEEHTSSETAIPPSSIHPSVSASNTESSASTRKRRRGDDVVVEVSKEIFLIRKATAGESGTGLTVGVGVGGGERHLGHGHHGHGHTRGVSSVSSMVSAVTGGSSMEKPEGSGTSAGGAGAGATGHEAGAGGGGWADGATNLAKGIGVDTRRYIEGLLTLNR